MFEVHYIQRSWFIQRSLFSHGSRTSIDSQIAHNFGTIILGKKISFHWNNHLKTIFCDYHGIVIDETLEQNFIANTPRTDFSRLGNLSWDTLYLLPMFLWEERSKTTNEILLPELLHFISLLLIEFQNILFTPPCTNFPFFKMLEIVQVAWIVTFHFKISVISINFLFSKFFPELLHFISYSPPIFTLYKLSVFFSFQNVWLHGYNGWNDLGYVGNFLDEILLKCSHILPWIVSNGILDFKPEILITKK